MLAVGFGCGLLGAVLTLAANPAPAVVALAPPSSQIASVEAVYVAKVPAVLTPIPEVAPTDRLMLVFRAGNATYMKLADYDGGTRYGKPRLFNSSEAVATVRAADVPEPYRAWLGKRVLVDGDCSAFVAGFAVVWRVSGEPRDIGEEGDAWTAEGVTHHETGAFVARLDGGGTSGVCGRGTYARAASLPPVVVPVRVENDALADAAKSALLASDAASEATAEWSKTEMKGTWLDAAEFDTRVLRHPTTGVTWVAIHAVYNDVSCGGPEVNLWGLFRADRDGTLTAVELRKLEGLRSIEKVIDIEGDGQLELIGSDWLGLDEILTDARGEVIDRLHVQFVGCPC